ncbi:MAG: hypothetical protein IJX91_04480 [Clostridia bacterium]|nr:hypothetical protein [Clostridia bacterium]
MKNYICINGIKTELTDDQMKLLEILNEPVATLSADGAIAKIGKYEFIVLKNDKTLGTVELLLKNTLGDDTVFGDTCDFKTSKVKGILDTFAKQVEEIVGEDNLLAHNVDLTALDGLKDYGSVETKMSLLTLAQYQEYIEILDRDILGAWWWLATPWSTPKHNYEKVVLCVSPRGYVYFNFSDYGGDGVRPFCVLKSNIFVSK